MSREGQAAVLNKEEKKRLRGAITQTEQPERNQAMISMSFGCGLRVKEISSLMVQDIVDGRGELKKSFTLESNQTKQSKKKGSNSREVFLDHPKLRKDLEAYLVGRGTIDGPLFLSRKRGSLSPNTMQMAFKNLFKRAGIEGASSHSGRRTFATDLIEQGIDIVKVSRLMGHTSIEMTKQYVQNNPEDLARATKGLDL